MENIQIHSNYPFKLYSKVIINNYNDLPEYAIVGYDEAIAAYTLNYYTDSTFTSRVVEKNEFKIDQLQDVGYEVLEIINN